MSQPNVAAPQLVQPHQNHQPPPSSIFKRTLSSIQPQLIHGNNINSCQWCGRKCQSSSALENHVRIHTGEQPFACPVLGCERKFKQRSQQYSHMRNRHQIDTNQLSKMSGGVLQQHQVMNGEHQVPEIEFPKLPFPVRAHQSTHTPFQVLQNPKLAIQPKVAPIINPAMPTFQQSHQAVVNQQLQQKEVQQTTPQNEFQSIKIAKLPKVIKPTPISTKQFYQIQVKTEGATESPALQKQRKALQHLANELGPQIQTMRSIELYGDYQSDRVVNQSLRITGIEQLKLLKQQEQNKASKVPPASCILQPVLSYDQIPIFKDVF